MTSRVVEGSIVGGGAQGPAPRPVRVWTPATAESRGGPGSPALQDARDEDTDWCNDPSRGWRMGREDESGVEADTLMVNCTGGDALSARAEYTGSKPSATAEPPNSAGAGVAPGLSSSVPVEFAAYSDTEIPDRGEP